MDAIIYHQNCPDGWCAALIAKRKYPEAKLIPMDHGQPDDVIEELTSSLVGKDVLMVDYTFRTYEAMRKLGYAAKSLTVFDHHRTAQDVLKKGIEELLDVTVISLSNGKSAFISSEDFEKISKYSWSEAKHGGAIAYTGGGRENPKFIYMHRLITGAADGILVDHINRNTLDNRRSNLRFASKKQNAANMDRGSGRKGVSQNGQKWIAQIAPDGKTIYLGTFDTVDEAAAAYDKAAKEHFGEFARRNFEDAPEPFSATAELVFDMTRSGAGLTWDYLFGRDSTGEWTRDREEREGGVDRGMARPWYVDYVEDRDLWNWKLPFSREICAYLGTLPFTEEAWADLDNITAEQAIGRGSGALAHIQHFVRETVKNVRHGDLDGYYVALLNATYLNCSEIGNELAKTADFSLTWFERKDDIIQFSLRSIGDFDVSAIAKSYGGGGHKNAAGFQLSIYEGRKLVDEILNRNTLPPPVAVGPRHG